MKRTVFLFLLGVFVTIGYAQEPLRTETKSQTAVATDTLTEEMKELVSYALEEAVLTAIDSIKNEGRYMQALDMINSIQAEWEGLTGKALTLRLYLKKMNIQMYLEEWRDLIATTEECLSFHKDEMTAGVAALVYDMQGTGYKYLEEYREAIRSYENGVYYYSEIGELNSQGYLFCSMAICYTNLEKYTMASSCYEKGLEKYLNYFETTRSVLLKSDFHIEDPYKQTALDAFALNLLYMAAFEEGYGDRSASKEYLLMAAHCGNESARREYQRVYGTQNLR